MVDYRLHEQLLAQLNTRVLKDYILSCKHNVTITEEKTTRGVDSQTRGNASIWRGGAARAGAGRSLCLFNGRKADGIKVDSTADSSAAMATSTGERRSTQGLAGDLEDLQPPERWVLTIPSQEAISHKGVPHAGRLDLKQSYWPHGETDGVHRFEEGAGGGARSCSPKPGSIRGWRGNNGIFRSALVCPRFDPPRF